MDLYYQPNKPATKKARTRACDVCHLRKVKCGKEFPQCSNCVKHKVPCTYLIAKGEAPTRKNEKKVIKSELFSQPLLETNVIMYPGYPIEMQLNKITKISSTDALAEAFKKLKVEDEFSSLFINTQGENIYFGNSPMGFYVSSKNVINKQNYDNLPKEKSKNNKFKSNTSMNEGALLSFDEQVTIDLIVKLVDLYFQQINSYQMLINKLKFYGAFRKPESIYQKDFLALLYAVCLSGCGHFHHKIVAPVLGNLFQYKTDQYIRQCYLKPSLYTVQALTSVCQYIGTHPNDIYSKKGWYYMLLAQRHATLLGFNKVNHKLSLEEQEIRKRIWWTMFIDDRVFTLCVGRQRTINNYCTNLELPKFTSLDQTQIDFESGIKFPIKEPTLDLCFFVSYIKYCRLLGKLSKAQNHYKKDPGFGSIQKIRMIENMFHVWYTQLPNNLHINKRLDWITLPYEKDSYSCILHIYYLSILVELNRPLIEPNELINFIFVESIGSNGIKISEFNQQNSITKCSIASKLGSQIIVNMGLPFVIQSPAYKWWCLMNFVFILSHHLELASNHALFSSVMKNLLLGLNNLAIEGGQRWPMVKQISVMVRNLLDAVP